MQILMMDGKETLMGKGETWVAEVKDKAQIALSPWEEEEFDWVTKDGEPSKD